MKRCRRTEPHLCTIGRHTAPERRVLPMPATVAALALAFAVLLASGGWRA